MLSFKSSLAAVLSIGAIFWLISVSIKPELVARVEVTKTAILVTNVTPEGWSSPVITLNDSKGGAQLALKGRWALGETRTLPLTEFIPLSGNRNIEATSLRVDQVTIFADGFPQQNFTREPASTSARLAKLLGLAHHSSLLVISGRDS